MDTADFYSQLLGISLPWKIDDVQLNMNDQRVDVKVTYTDKKALCECRKECSIHDRTSERSWRHLDTCQMMTYIHCRLPRTKCEDCKVKTLSAPWAAPRGRFTAMFESLVIDWLIVSRNQTKVAEQMKLSFDEVNGIMRRAVDRGLERRELEVITKLSIDEKSMKKGHRYLSVLSDPGQGTVLEVCESRTKNAVKKMLKSTLTQDQLNQVECISMDMWKGFMNAAEEVLEFADIVHDRFHISQYLGKAVDTTRKAENRRLNKEGNDDLKNSKYLFLRNLINLKDEHLSRFLKAIKASEKTALVWKYKEAFRSFFEIPSIEDGRRFLKKWFDQAVEEDIPALTKVAATIMIHKEGVLNYLKHRITNAGAEALNGKIQDLKTRARGFYSFENYRTNILFHFGGLNLMPNPLKSL